MKKIILIPAIIISTSCIYSQTDLNTRKTAEPNKETNYCCPKGDHCSKAPGKKCPSHHLALAREGTYCCAACNTTSDTQRKCPKCGKEMKEINCGQKK